MYTPIEIGSSELNLNPYKCSRLDEEDDTRLIEINSTAGFVYGFCEVLFKAIPVY